MSHERCLRSLASVRPPNDRCQVVSINGGSRAGLGSGGALGVGAGAGSGCSPGGHWSLGGEGRGVPRLPSSPDACPATGLAYATSSLARTVLETPGSRHVASTLPPCSSQDIVSAYHRLSWEPRLATRGLQSPRPPGKAAPPLCPVHATLQPHETPIPGDAQHPSLLALMSHGQA